MIHLKQNYRGRLTKNQLIPPGKYEETDPALFGLAEYLIENGHAVRIAPVPSKPALTLPLAANTPAPLEIPSIGATPPPTDDPGASPNIPPYADLGVELLQAEIAKRGLGDTVVPTGKNGNAIKVDLIKALEEADAAAQPPQE